MKKINIIFRLTIIFLSTALLVSLIYSWYIDSGIIKDTSFNILQIDSLITVYEAEDVNFNGVPDKIVEANKYYKSSEDESGSYIEYKNKYYDEKYSFKFYDQKYALSQDSEANTLLPISIKDAAPSKIYTYKYEITNYLDNLNKLELFTLESSNSDDELKNFSIRVVSISRNTTLAFSDWYILTNSGICIDRIGSSPLVVPKTSDTDHGRLDIWLQIRINSDSVTPISELTNYNSQTNTFDLPSIKIKLTAETNE